VITELDQYGNLETTDSSTVITASLRLGNGPLLGRTTARLVGGVATFTGLADASIGTIELGFSGGGLTVGPSNPILISATGPNGPGAAQAPLIIGAHVLTMRKTNKKGRPAGKAVFAGFTLEYSVAMNAATAGLATNYVVVSNTTKHVQKKTVTVHTPVALTAAYDPTTNSVHLTIQGKPKFANGGQITIINAPPSGVSSATGDFLAAIDTVFTILPNARGIRPG
jgi:hypothetical protein